MTLRHDQRIRDEISAIVEIYPRANAEWIIGEVVREFCRDESDVRRIYDAHQRDNGVC